MVMLDAGVAATVLLAVSVLSCIVLGEAGRMVFLRAQIREICRPFRVIFGID
jgi:hypothetical protein